MAGFLTFARQRVFPESVSSDFLCAAKKAITVAGTAPDLHRIPSLRRLLHLHGMRRYHHNAFAKIRISEWNAK